MKFLVWFLGMVALCTANASLAENPYADTGHRAYIATLSTGAQNNNTLIFAAANFGDVAKYWSCLSLGDTTTIYIVSLDHWSGRRRIVIPPGVSISQPYPDGPFLDSLIVKKKASGAFFEAIVNY